MSHHRGYREASGSDAATTAQEAAVRAGREADHHAAAGVMGGCGTGRTVPGSVGLDCWSAEHLIAVCWYLDGVNTLDGVKTLGQGNITGVNALDRVNTLDGGLKQAGEAAGAIREVLRAVFERRRQAGRCVSV